MRKIDIKLIVAWLLFLFAILLFFGLTKIFFKLREDQRFDYEYRIVINDSVLKKQFQEQKNKNIEKKEEVVKIDSDEANYVDLEQLLYEKTKYGELPRISPDGFRPCDAFAAEYSIISEKLIHVVVIVSSGDADLLAESLDSLGNAKVTFILPTYLSDIDNLAKLVVDHGHEFFIQLPTQSSIPISDKHKVSPILANSSFEDITNKFSSFLASTKKYIGIANITPTLLTKSSKDMDFIAEQISSRGLAMLDLEPSNEILTNLAKKNNFYYINIEEKFLPETTKNINKDIVVKLSDLSKFLEIIKTQNTFSLAPVSEKFKKNETL